MINAFIFFGHFLFALIVFSKKWQDESMKEGILNLALIGIIFSVGWSIATMVSKLFLEPKGFGIFFDRDAFSLTLLSIAEYFFFRIYYKDLFAIGADRES